jgi:hypothetical protein
MRHIIDTIKKIPRPEEAAQRPPRRTCGADPAEIRIPAQPRSETHHFRAVTLQSPVYCNRSQDHRRPAPGGLDLLSVSGAGLRRHRQEQRRGEPYYTWVDQHDTLGLGKDVPISTGDENDALLALVNGMGGSRSSQIEIDQRASAKPDVPLRLSKDRSTPDADAISN